MGIISHLFFVHVSGCKLPVLFSTALDVQIDHVFIDENDTIPVGADVTYLCKKDETQWRTLTVSEDTCKHESGLSGKTNDNGVGSYCGIINQFN